MSDRLMYPLGGEVGRVHSSARFGHYITIKQLDAKAGVYRLGQIAQHAFGVGACVLNRVELVETANGMAVDSAQPGFVP